MVFIRKAIVARGAIREALSPRARCIYVVVRIKTKKKGEEKKLEERRINANDSSAASSKVIGIGDREPAIARRKVQEAYFFTATPRHRGARSTTLHDSTKSVFVH